MKSLNQSIKESTQWTNGEVHNIKLRKLLDKAGYDDVHLYKANGDGYFYVGADEGTKHDSWLNALQSTSIYIYAFNQQSPDRWFKDIEEMLLQGKEEFE